MDCKLFLLIRGDNLSKLFQSFPDGKIFQAIGRQGITIGQKAGKIELQILKTDVFHAVAKILFHVSLSSGKGFKFPALLAPIMHGGGVIASFFFHQSQKGRKSKAVISL